MGKGGSAARPGFVNRASRRRWGTRRGRRTMIMRTRPVTKPGSLWRRRTTSRVLERLMRAERASWAMICAGMGRDVSALVESGGSGRGQERERETRVLVCAHGGELFDMVWAEEEFALWCVGGGVGPVLARVSQWSVRGTRRRGLTGERRGRCGARVPAGPGGMKRARGAAAWSEWLPWPLWRERESVS